MDIVKEPLINSAAHLTSFNQRFLKECDRQSIDILPIAPADCNRVEGLPHLHEDPFDRIIISQAMERGLVLPTKDERIRQYGNVETLW